MTVSREFMEHVQVALQLVERATEDPGAGHVAGYLLAELAGTLKRHAASFHKGHCYECDSYADECRILGLVEDVMISPGLRSVCAPSVPLPADEAGRSVEVGGEETGE